jgi:hypothetical protein
MKVVSIFTIDPSTAAPPSPEMQQRMGELIAEMRSKGILIETGGRGPGSDMLELRVSRKNGSYAVTDGPFTEAKEIVGGFALMELQDREDAVAWSRRFLDLIGDGTCTLHEVEMAP